MTAVILIVFALTIHQPRYAFGESYTAFVKRNLQQLCPYSDFCSHKAIDTLSQNQSSCCLPCSCEATCRSHGTCCPDYEQAGETALTTELEPCISLLEDGIKDSGRARFRERFNGVNDGINFYHTAISCPAGFTDQQIINKCTSTVPEEVVDAARVSDRKGQVYRNRNCAICHGVTNFITWELKMTYSRRILEEDFSELNVSSLLNNGFKFQSIPPATHVDFLTRCYIPEFTACNQTGKWDVFDNYTHTACNSLTIGYMAENFRTTLYKNPFCYLCNQNHIYHRDLSCRATDVGKSPSSSFTAVINLDEEKRKKTRQEAIAQEECREYEILDQHFGVCRRLLCPTTKYPIYGKCQDHFKNAQGMSLKFQIDVNISYGNTSEAISDREFMNTNENARLLTDAFLVNSGVSTTSCTVCTMSLKLFVEGHPDVDHLILAEFSTNEDCFVDDVFALMEDNLNRKSFQISVDNITIIITTVVAFPLQSLNVRGGLQSAVSVYMLYNDHCMEGRLITNPKFYCPHVDLLHMEYIQYVSGNITGVMESSEDFSMFKIQDIPGNENGTVYSICIKDYLLQKVPSAGSVVTSNTMIWLLGLLCAVMALIM